MVEFMRRGHGNDSLLLDDLDHEILRILEEDCTLTYHEIAKRLVGARGPLGIELRDSGVWVLLRGVGLWLIIRR